MSEYHTTRARTNIGLLHKSFLARDAFLRTNRRAIAIMFVRLSSVRLSVCLSVRLGRVFIVITRCSLARLDSPLFWAP